MSYKISNPFRYKIQVWEPPAEYKSQTDIEEIKKAFGKNKVILKHLENLFYETIAHYPELKDTYLFIKETKFYGVQHTLRAYPSLLSLPNKRKDRVYPIVINTNKNAPIPFYSLLKKQQKGILAHEFAHIIDYSKRTSMQIIGLCFNLMFSKKFIEKFEHCTDETTIKRGHGGSLLEFREHIIEKGTLRYAKYYEKMYLSPERIKNEVEKNLSKTTIVNPKKFNPKYFIYSIGHSIETIWSFFPAITEMMVLVYIKKVHKNSKT